LGEAGFDSVVDCVDGFLHWDGAAAPSLTLLLLLMAKGADSGGSFWQYGFVYANSL